MVIPPKPIDPRPSAMPAASVSPTNAVLSWFDRLWMRLGADLVLVTGTASLTMLVLASARQPIAPALLRSTLAVLVPMITWRWGGKVGLLSALFVETAAMSMGTMTGGTSRLWELAASLASMFLMVAWVRLKRRQADHDHDVSRHDPLTGLLNRQAWYEQLQVEISRATRSPRPFSVVLLDCDGFKPLNDHFGHLTGDEVLKRIARVLQEHVRAYDAVGRLGGDEFVIVLAEADLEVAESVIERLRAGLRHGVERDYPGLTVSLGVAVFRDPPASVEVCLHHADTAMYAAKHRGQGETVFDVVAMETPSGPITLPIMPQSETA